MPFIRASASAVIPATASRLYGILADYRDGHPHIVPPKYFRNLAVEAGGRGAGTRIRFEVRAFGSVRTIRAEIAEPEPGRVLVETDLDSGVRTTFTVEPVPGGGGASVTISTVYEKAGVAGWVESLLSPRFLRAVYREELQRLADRAR
jgi:hypothetical protein